VSKLVEVLAAELERPRELSPRVVNYISGRYGVDYDDVGNFLVEKLPALEDDEIDLILSPAFTPILTDQAVVAEVLGRDSVSQDQWPALVQALVARPTRAQFVTLDGRQHSVALREVTIERYVHRLRLDGRISESVAQMIDTLPSGDRATLRAIARRVVWESEGARGILERYLTSSSARGRYSLDDSLDLLNLVEGRKPLNIEDLLSRIPAWREALRQQIDAAGGPSPFFSEDVQRMHGDGRDQRQHDDGRVAAKQREWEFLGRLSELLL
jgi:hypothetical protein